MIAKSGSHYSSTSRTSYTHPTYVYEGMRCAGDHTPKTHAATVCWEPAVGPVEPERGERNVAPQTEVCWH